MKILVTEVGSKSSGDEAICIGAARRLISMGAEVTFCYRVSLDDALRKAGLDAEHVHMPIEEEFNGISTPHELIRAFAEKMPSLFREMRSLVSRHDLVAVAPGGKFTEGLKNARSLLTATIAQVLGVPVIVLHQSVGPLFNENHKKLLAEVFRRCKMVLVRDDRSMEFLREIEIPGDILVRCRDVALGEEYPAPASAEFDVGVNIRYGSFGHVNLDAVARFVLGYKALHTDARILVYSTTWNLYGEALDFLSSLPCDVKPEMPSYPNYLHEVGRCAINVSDSWHGCIFSMMANRPVVFCQTDLKSWKMKGAHAPDQEPLEIFPGLVSLPEADVVLNRVALIEKDPSPVIEMQRHLVRYGRELCEEGWRAVEKIVKIRTRRSPLRRLLNAMGIS